MYKNVFFVMFYSEYNVENVHDGIRPNNLGIFYGSDVKLFHRNLSTLRNIGEEHVPEELWGGSDIMPSWRGRQEELLL